MLILFHFANLDPALRKTVGAGDCKVSDMEQNWVIYLQQKYFGSQNIYKQIVFCNLTDRR